MVFATSGLAAFILTYGDVSGNKVRSINRAQNRGAGACIGNACRGLDDGAQIEIIVVP